MLANMAYGRWSVVQRDNAPGPSQVPWLTNGEHGDWTEPGTHDERRFRIGCGLRPRRRPR